MAKYKITWVKTTTYEGEFDDDFDVDSWAWDCRDEVGEETWDMEVERL